MRAYQCGIEQGAARVGVDFYELGAVGADVKVVAHKNTQRAVVCLRIGTCRRQRLRLPTGQGHHPLDGLHGIGDGVHHVGG